MTDAEDLLSQLGDDLQAALEPLGGCGSLEPWGPTKEISDAVTTMVARDPTGRPVAVIHRSAPNEANLVRRHLDRSRAARRLLGPRLGAVIMEPLLERDLDDVTAAVFPYCERLSDHMILWPIQRRRYLPEVLAWLRGVIQQTAAEPEPDEVQTLFRSPLRDVCGNERFSGELRQGARAALDRLESGDWPPRLVLAHNDFWKHNILRAPRASGAGGPHPFVVIDWPASRTRGHAIFDLLRLAHSTQMSSSTLVEEIEAHCALLACDPIDAAAHLFASLGVLGRNLGCFCPTRYVEMGETCFRELYRALALRSTASDHAVAG